MKDAINEALRDWAANYETTQLSVSPDLLIACVGGGSNTIGFFHHFIDDENVKLIGVEAGGDNMQKGKHEDAFKS